VVVLRSLVCLDDSDAAPSHNYCGGTMPGSRPQREAQSTVAGQRVNLYLSLSLCFNDSISDLIYDLFVLNDSICEVTNRSMICSSSVILDLPGSHVDSCCDGLVAVAAACTIKH